MWLDMGVNASGQGGYSAAAVPAAALPSAQASGLTVGQKGFGIVAGGDGGGPRTAALGCIGAGVISLGLLVFVWWSLPR